jgi:hypothetical protein
MISQLFALPLRALIVAAALPTPPALGDTLAGPDDISRSAMAVSVDDHTGFALEAHIAPHSVPRSTQNPAGRWAAW